MIYSEADSTIETDRLLLRRFRGTDAEKVRDMCDNYNMYRSTLNLPYPYTLGHAHSWIALHDDHFKSDRLYEFAITDISSGELYGAVALSNRKQHRNGELAYWVGEDHWGKGYGTEASRAMIEFAFEVKGFHRVYAYFFASNPASGRIMEKCGMQYEGTQKEHIYKEGTFEDIVSYGIINPSL